jgi:hypothetical protein
MKAVERSEVLGLGEYEKLRDRFRARVIEEKKRRRVTLGPKASAVFESHDTVLMQIQEMLRTERISREGAILHEIETYNDLVPGERQLSATVMIEIDDKGERDAFLAAARGMEKDLALLVDGERFGAEWEKTRELPDKLSAVLYLKFTLSERAVAAVKGRRAKCALVVESAAYAARAELGSEVVASLADDLES